MIFQDIVAVLHQFEKFLAAVGRFREIIADALSENVVRTHEIVSIVAVLPDQAVTVADAGVEFPLIVSELILKRLDQLIGFRRGDLIGAVVENDTVGVVVLLLGQGHHVAAVSRLVGLHFNAHADCLQRRTTFGVHCRVKRKNRHIGGVAFGHHSVGNVGNHSDQRL